MIVCNTSPIINLACIGQLDLLRELYQEIVIPSAVFDEITVSRPDAPGAAEVKTADWIRKIPVANSLLVASLRLELDPGEAEAIACAVENQAKLLLIDERRGRLVAQRLGVPVLGLLGVLLLSKRRDLIKAVRPLMDDLRSQAGFWISEALYHHVLMESGEA